MEPLDPRDIGYDDKKAYDQWCHHKGRLGRLKTCRGHLRAIEEENA